MGARGLLTAGNIRARSLIDHWNDAPENRQHLDCVDVVAPSTAANLGPGFDVFGLALDAFQDVVKVEVSHTTGIEIKVLEDEMGVVSEVPEKNTAGLAARMFLQRLGLQVGLRITLAKGVPVGKGLGSSGASAAACVVGLNRLLGLELSKNELVELAAEGEIAAAGAPHADNVAAAVFGGFTLVMSYDPPSVIGLSAPSNLEVAIALPDIPVPSLKTRAARAMLPPSVPLEKMVHNVAHAAGVVAGVLSGDVGLIGQCMDDAVAEPVRSRLIPGYVNVKEKGMEAGASGVALSGAGPAMIAIVDSNGVAAIEVAKAMKQGFEEVGVGARALCSRPSRGAVVVNER